MLPTGTCDPLPPRLSPQVVRAGLTPKFKDVDVLVEMLTYRTGAPAVDVGAPVDAHTRAYRVPVPEFELQRTALVAADGPYDLPPPRSAAILIVVEGAGAVTSTAGAPPVALGCGQVWLQEAGSSATLSTDAGVVLFRAMAGGRA